MIIHGRFILILRWIIGVSFLLIGLTSLRTPLFSLASISLATLLIPPTLKFIQDKFNRTFPRKHKVTALIVLLLLSMISAPETNISRNDLSDEQNNQPSAVPISHENEMQTITTEPSVANSESQSEKPQQIAPIEPPIKTTEPTSANTVTPTLKPQLSSTPTTTNCDPNYSGCVPIASDVDCAGGTGDGPVYVNGPINVIGYDVYKLDRDKDGIACE